jgi:hypothetical protein
MSRRREWNLWQDIRWRADVEEESGFTGVAVLTLALGIGANTAIFSVVNAVLLKPLPYPEPGRLVQLCKDTPSGERRTVIGSNEFVAFRSQSDSFARLAAYAGGDRSLRGSEQADRILCGDVTVDFFPLLGIQPMLGRNFTAEEDAPNGPRVAILGYALCRADSAVIAVFWPSIILNEHLHRRQRAGADLSLPRTVSTLDSPGAWAKRHRGAEAPASHRAFETRRDAAAGASRTAHDCPAGATTSAGRSPSREPGHVARADRR